MFGKAEELIQRDRAFCWHNARSAFREHKNNGEKNIFCHGRTITFFAQEAAEAPGWSPTALSAGIERCARTFSPDRTSARLFCVCCSRLLLLLRWCHGCYGMLCLVIETRRDITRLFFV